MENVAISKRQAMEFAKGIVEARDAELAFLLQLQEIVKCTTPLPDDHELEESPSQPLLIGIDLQDNQIAADKDKAVALTVAVEELGTLVVETEETQLSLLEADRLAHLDAIQEHDAQFARSIENVPDEDWEEIGDEMEEPFDSFHGPNELLAYNEADDQLDSVLLQLGDAASSLPRKRLQSGLRKSPLVIRRVNVPSTHELIAEQRGKGKEKVHQETVLATVHEPNKKRRERFRLDSLEREDGDTPGQTDERLDDGECGQRVCQICFDATTATNPFVSLEGCGHKFCETCVSRHAEAKILDGQTHITCPHGDCRTTISFTQLSFLLNSKMLEILSRRQIEAAIPVSERLYCPFEDCSALLCKPEPSYHVLRPSSSAHPHSTTTGCVECDACHRAFCLECEVAWHSDMSCAEYKAHLKNRSRLGDEKLLQLADKQKWQRCRCGRVIELIQGCYYMSCISLNEVLLQYGLEHIFYTNAMQTRSLDAAIKGSLHVIYEVINQKCGHSFCYNCGAPWPSEKKKTCSCPQWSESKLRKSSTGT